MKNLKNWFIVEWTSDKKNKDGDELVAIAYNMEI